MVVLIRAAGVVQLVIVAANLLLPRLLSVGRHLARLPSILRQIFLVHWIYIVLVLVMFSVLCLGFAPELAGDTPLGRTLSACLAIFWLPRVAIQTGYYDAELKRRLRLGNLFFTAAFAYLGIVFAIATLRLLP